MPDNNNGPPPTLAAGVTAGAVSSLSLGAQSANVPYTAAAAAGTDIPVRTTIPDQILRHDIADEELEMLGSLNRDGLVEAIWGCVGIAVGGIIPTLASLMRAYGDAKPALDSAATQPVALTGLELFQFTIVLAGVVGAGVLGFVARKRSKKSFNLVQKIRNRTATRSGHVSR